jgi:hypothetical protein
MEDAGSARTRVRSHVKGFDPLLETASNNRGASVAAMTHLAPPTRRTNAGGLITPSDPVKLVYPLQQLLHLRRRVHFDHTTSRYANFSVVDQASSHISILVWLKPSLGLSRQLGCPCWKRSHLGGY